MVVFVSIRPARRNEVFRHLLQKSVGRLGWLSQFRFVLAYESCRDIACAKLFVAAKPSEEPRIRPDRMARHAFTGVREIIERRTPWLGVRYAF